MKLFFAFGLIFLPYFSQAQSIEQQMQQAYTRENRYLAAQVQELKRQMQELDQGATRSSAELEKKLRLKEREMVRLQLLNEHDKQRLTLLEKQESQIASEKSQWQALYKRISEMVNKIRTRLNDNSSEEIVAREGSEAQILAQLSKLSNLYQKLTTLSQESGEYYTKEGDLQSGTLLKVGGFGAYGLKENKAFLLAPEGKALQIVEEISLSKIENLIKPTADTVNLNPIYLFSSLTDKIALKKPATLADRFADYIPSVFLLLLFAVIAWLFYRIALV